MLSTGRRRTATAGMRGGVPAAADAPEPASMPCAGVRADGVLMPLPDAVRPPAASCPGQQPRRRAAATAASPASSIAHEAGSGTAASGVVPAPIQSLLAIASE